MDVTLGLPTASALRHTAKPDVSVMEKLFQRPRCFQGRDHPGLAGEG